MGKIAFLFPGQGSQKVGMGQSFAENNYICDEIFNRANEKLKFNLSSLIFSGPKEQLTLTYNAQPALLTTSIAALKRFQQAGIRPDFVAGHSLGEYSALIASKALFFEDGLYAVRKRGLYMEEAVPNGEGTMAAVLGLDKTILQSITDDIQSKGLIVQLANINCPGQIVISGEKEAIILASKKAEEAGARRVIPLQVSGPFHSKLMKKAATKFAKVLDEINISDAEIPIVCNVTATPIKTSTEIKENLLKQMYSPVLWEDSVKYMINSGVRTFIEIGNGKVLSGLVKKIDREVQVLYVQDEESYNKTLKVLQEG